MSKDLPPQLANAQTGLYIVHGRRNSGKTTLIQKLLYLWEGQISTVSVFQTSPNHHDHYESCCPNVKTIPFQNHMIQNLLKDRKDLQKPAFYNGMPDVWVFDESLFTNRADLSLATSERQNAKEFTTTIEHLTRNVRHYHLIVLLANSEMFGTSSFVRGHANWLFLNYHGLDSVVAKWFRNHLHPTQANICRAPGLRSQWSVFYKTGSSDLLSYLPLFVARKPEQDNETIHIILYTITALSPPLINIICCYHGSRACAACQSKLYAMS